MHHVALNGPRPHNRDFDHEIIETLRRQARQHRHLRAAFDLKHADGIRAADHLVGRGIFGGYGREIESDAFGCFQQIKGAAHAAQHAEAQHVDLHEFQRIDIVLVPFDHLPVFHGGRFDRHHLVKPVQRQHEAAGMLRQMPRRAHQFLGQLKRQAQPAVGRVQIEFLQLGIGNAVVAPAPGEAGQRSRDIFRHAKRLADLAHRAARAIARHTCR